MSNPALLTTPLIEQHLMLLYSGMDLSPDMRTFRYALSVELHRRTGKWFAARFY